MNSMISIALRKVYFVMAFLFIGSLSVYAQNPITTQPSDQTGCNTGGFTATFSINSVTGGIYVWQADTGNGFNAVPNSAPFSGVNTNSMSILNPDGCKGAYTQDQTWFRCVVLVVSGPSAGTWYSDSAQLNIHTPVTASDMKIQRGTFSTNVLDSNCQGESTWFKVTNLTGTCVPVKSAYYQWQMRPSGGGAWSNVVSGTSQTDSLVLGSVDTSDDGNQYRCRILTDICTDTFYSDIVTLLVVPTPNAVLGKATGDLITSFNSAGQSVIGSMFDVTPSKGLVVDSLAINLTTGASGKVRVYIKKGTYFNFENTPGAWTLVDSANVTSAGQDNPTSFPVTFPLESDVTYGIFIDASDLTTGKMRHINGVSAYSDDNIYLLNGSSPTAKWTSFIPSRSWCGIIYYSNGPNFPENGDTVTVCKGDPVQFGYRISNTTYKGVSSNWRLTHTDPSSSVEYPSPVTGTGDTSYLDEIRTGSLAPGYYTFTLNTVSLTTTAGFPDAKCSNTLSESFVIRVLPLPQLEILDVMDPICNGDLLRVRYRASNGFNGDNYSFTYDINSTSPFFPGTVTGTLGSGGTYTGIFIAADTVLRPPTTRKISFGPIVNTTTGCISSDSIGDSTFRIDPTPLVDISGNPTVCSGTFDPITGDVVPGWTRYASFSFTTSGTTVGASNKGWTFYYRVKNLATGEYSTTHSRSGTGNSGGGSSTLNVPDSLFLHYNANGTPGSFRIIIDSLVITSGGGCSNHIPMDSTNFTVNSIPYMTFDLPDSICLGTQLQFYATVTGVRGTGTPDNWSYSYSWDQTPFDPSPFSGPSSATGSDTGTFLESSNFPISTGMWYWWTDSIVNTTTGCIYKPESNDSFRVDAPTLGGTINGSTTHCEGDNEGYLWLTGYNGDILYWLASYDEGITWDTVKVSGNAPENRPVSFSSQLDTLYYLNKTYKTRYRAVVKNGACDTALSTVGGVFMTPQPGVSIANFDNFVCLGDSAELELFVFNMASSDSWTVYYTQTDSTRSDTFSGVGPGFFTKNVYFLSAIPSTIRIDSIINNNSGCANRYDSTQLVDSVFVYSFTSAGTLAASDTICNGNNSGTLTISGTIGDIQKWQYSTDGTLSWTDINRTDSFYVYNNVTGETNYRVVVRNGTCPEDVSDTVTLSVIPLPTVYITGADTICQGTSLDLTIHVDSTSGGDWAVSYQVGSATDTVYGTGDGTFVLNSGNLGSNATVNLQKIWITNPVGSFPACENTNILIPSSATITVIPFVSATVSSLNDTICSGTNKVVQISINNASVGDTIQVLYSINGSLQSPLTFVGPGSHNFTIPGSSLIATSSPSTDYIVRMDSTINLSATNACVGFMSDSFIITVDTLTNPGMIADNDTICYGGSGSVEEIAAGLGVIVKWQSRVQGSPTWIDINTTDTLLSFSSLTDTTEYRAVYQNGVCSSAPSNSVTIVPKPLPTATIQAVPGYDTVCSNTAAILSLIVSNVEAGDSVVITYTQGSANKTAGSRIGSNPDTIQIMTDPIGTNTTVVLKTISNVDPQGGQPACANNSLTSQVSITVVDQPAVSFLNGPDTLCNGEDVLFAFIVSNLQTTDDWELVYELEGDLDTITDTGPGIFFWFDSDPNFPGDAEIIIRSLTNLTNYGCAILDADTWSFYLNESTVAGVIAGPDTLCIGEGTTLRQVDSIPRIGNLIRWENRPESSSTWTSMGTADTSITVSSLSETTYYRAIYQNKNCDTVRSNVVEIWVRPLPLATISGSSAICSGDTIDLTITVTDVRPGQDWEIKLLEGSTNKTITGTGPGNFPYTVTGTSGTITVTLQEISTTSMNPQCQNTSLTNNAVASVTVNQLPAATLASLSDSVCVNDSANGLAIIGNVISGESWRLYWTINNADLDSLNGVGPGSFSFSTMPLTVNPSVLRLTRVLNTTTGCEFTPTDTGVVYVNPETIAGTLTGIDSVCAGSNSGSLTLSGRLGDIVRWEYSTNGGTSWTDILLTDSTHSYSNLTTTRDYRVLVKNGICPPKYSNVVRIYVQPIPLATIGGSGSICSGDTFNLTITVSNVLPGQNWSIKLLEGTTNKTFTGTGSGNFSYPVTGNSGTVTVTLQEIRTTSLKPQCENLSLTNNAVASVTFLQLPSATLTTLADSVCTGSSAAGQANIGNVVTGQTWKLYWTINNTALDSTTGTGPGSSNFTTDPLTVNPSILRLTRIVNTTTGCEYTASDTDFVIVSPQTIPGVLSGSDTLCLVPNSGTIRLSGWQGKIVRWESSIDSGATWSPILSTDSFLNYNNISATTHFRVVVKSGFCAARYSTVARIHIRPLPIAEINTVGSNVICEGDSTYIAIDILNVWPTQTWRLNYNIGSFADSLTGTGSMTDTIFTGPLFSNTTITLKSIVITSGDPMCSNTNLVNRHTTTITVNPMPLATITQSPDTVCKGTTPDITVLVSQVNTGQPWSINYIVRSNSGTTTRSTSGAGPGQVTFSIGQLNTEGPVIVKLMDISSTRFSTTCTNQLNDSVVIFVDSTSLGGTISGPSIVCYNSGGKLSLSGYRGNVLKWQYSTDGVNYFDIANTADTLMFNGLLAKTWFRARVQNGICGPEYSAAFTVDIQPLPTVTIGNPTQNICNGDTATLNLTIGNIRTTDTWTITYLQNGTTKTFNGTGRSASMLVGPLTATTDIEIIAINVTSGRMCADTTLNEQATLVVFDNPNATISAIPDSLCQGDILVFSVTVNNIQSGTQWELDYDVDGSAGATVSGSGSKTVNINTNRAVKPNQALIELTSIEITSSPFCQSILAEDTTVPVFPTTVGGLITASSLTICQGDDVDLTLNGSVGSVLRWEYSIDSGFTWTVLANTDTFLNPGNLTRTTLFRAFVKSGPCSGKYSSNAIIIDVVPTPDANITSTDVVCPGEQATFTVQVINVRPSHGWEVTYSVDGVLQTNTVKGTGSGLFNFTVPGKPYAGNPTYIVVELVSIKNTTQNCENTNLSSSAQARVTPNPVAAFSTENTCEDTLVIFRNLSTIVEGSVSGYYWFFGDGDSSSNAEPTHMYPDAGTYSAILVAVSDNGCIGRDTQDVVVYDDPIANFNFLNSCLNKDFAPTDASTIDNGNIVAWFWDFGDGNTSTAQNPLHRYDVAGNYQVSLTVTSDNGCASTVTKAVIIYVLPDANFISIPVCEDEAMEFVNTTSIAYGTTRFEWDFASQGTSFLRDPKFAFTGFGGFNVTLAAISDQGCGDTITKAVIVHPKPVVAFTVDPVCVGEPSIFQNLSSIPTGTMNEFYWDFGDSIFSGLMNPIHTYPRSGFFSVKLRIVSDNGCSDSISQQAQVVPLPDVQLVALGPVEFCEGDSVVIAANQNARTWRWIMPDSTVSIDVDRIVAVEEGWYKVTITAPPIGCENSDSIYITVHPSPIAKAWPRDKTEQNRDTISKGAGVQLHAEGGISYVWTPDEKLNNAFIADPFARDLREETVFIVEVTDDNGCKDTAKVTIVILDNFDLVVYNVVSPNGDGHNDAWFIENILAYPEANVVIVNRYGMEVFNSKGYQNNWEGTSEDGKDLPDGAYYYIITHPDFKEPIYTGAINLIRNTN